ncbi:MAG: VWA domain-containing protein [Hyphomicrobiales bacterium]|nr:VWA domain-containing protein [Hyphomicrobiales bacterium]
MLLAFFEELRRARVPVSVKEHLMLMEALAADLADKRMEDFYYLARAALVKDERLLDKFDRVFARVFQGVETTAELTPQTIPEEWLKALTERVLTDEEKAEIEALGGWEKIMEELKKRLEEQKGRHQGGSKWIGTGGTSPFGAYGYNPAGVRIGQAGNRNFRAVKVWDKREFKDLDGDVQLGARSMQVALRRLRQFARSGAKDRLALEDTINATAHRGYLDLRFEAERRNAVKVLAFFDVGGSMDWHVAQVERLFTAARSEFKHLEYFYFHNCVYETVWRDNARRHAERTPTMDVLRTYGPDYKLIFVGDASMSPYEIALPGGSVEHWNDEPGEVWLSRLVETYKSAVWLNPAPEAHWAYTASVGMIASIMQGRMFPLTQDGLEAAVRELAR